MRVLLSTIGSAGDVHSPLDVGLALREREHEAIIVANPFFEATARRLGLGSLALGERATYLRTMTNPDLWRPTRGFRTVAARMILPRIAPLYEIIARHDPATTVVFAAGLCFGARIAQEKLGVRPVTHHLAPGPLWSRRQPPALAGPAAAGWDAERPG